MEPILKHFKKNVPAWDGVDRSARTVGCFAKLPEIAPKFFRGCRTEILLSIAREQLVVERIAFPPGARVPLHRHPNVSSLDFGISGSGCLSVGNHTFIYDDANRGPLPLYVPRGVLHYGEVVGDKGAMIVSFQYWYEWPPKDSIALDWEDG